MLDWCTSLLSNYAELVSHLRIEFWLTLIMLPVCAATPSCYSSPQIHFHGRLQHLSRSQRAFEARFILEDRLIFGAANGFPYEKTPALKSFLYNHVRSSEHCASYPNELYVKCYSNKWYYPVAIINEPSTIGNLQAEEAQISLIDQSMERIDVVPDNVNLMSDMKDKANDSQSTLKTNVEDLLESIGGLVGKRESAMTSSLDTVTSSMNSALKSSKEAIYRVVSEVSCNVGQTRELAGNGWKSFSYELENSTSNLVVAAADVLRHVIVIVEETVLKGATVVVYSYGSVKELLPPEIQNVINSFEEKVETIFSPVYSILQQVYIGIEGLERSLGLDTNDPIIQFVVLFGISFTLWVLYFFVTFGGYSGDLSPKSTLELLNGKSNVVLIDVRPENLREKDGIPDFRRGARFRYANADLPEVDGSLKKLLKRGRELDDYLTAAIIRNLKIVQDRGKVIVMDADGTRSKGIARSLRKLGVQRPYLLRGGFRSWEKQGFRIKELKPETALTILNEEAEAILEDISPTPVQVLGYGVGTIASIYAVLDWEKTLQLIGVVGLGQTIVRRIASYEDVKDFRQDMSLLLAPVIAGAQALSWAAGKLETNGIGLPTSPSSLSAIQTRVLQAAAKHESQSSETEETLNPSSQTMSPASENLDLSEA